MKRPEDEIKRLLLAAELDLLERLRQRCEHLETRVGDDPSMRESLRGVILEVLRDAGVRDHDRLAKVLAPLVLTSMREEIRNSRDLMVDALYPITGRLVAAAVSNAFRELMETLNEKLDDSFSLERWKIRLRAKATGQSEAELQLQRSPPFEIEDLLLIHRRTGLLIARARDENNAGEGVDSDLVGGMLTAIMAFSRDAMGDDGSSELRSLSLEGSDLFLRASPAVILAVKAHGPAPRAFQGALEDLFCGFLENWGEFLRDYDGAATEEATRGLIIDLRERFDALETSRRQNFRGRSYAAHAVLASLLLVVLAWGGYVAYQSWRIADIEATARQVVAAEPAVQGYPIELRYDVDAARLRVEGLVSNVEARDALDRALAMALTGVQSELRLNFLPRGDLERLATGYQEIAGRLDALEAAALRLNSSFAGMAASIDGQTEVLRQRTGNLEGLANGLGGTVDALSERLVTRLDRLEQKTGSLEQRAGSFERSLDALSKSLDTQFSQFERKAKDLEGLTGGLETSIHGVSQSLDSRLEQQSGNLWSMAKSFRVSVDTWSQSLGARLDQLDQRLVALEIAGSAPLDKLYSWTTRHSIFFSRGTNFKWSGKAEAKLRDLAALLLATPSEVHLRVVGYSDETGTLAENQRVSSARAGAVTERLRALDVPAERMAPVGRGAERPLTGTTGGDSANRRVEFELIFSGVY
jgi:outer membrane protein OmpA-like peptidoglycan-associated protein